MFRTTIGSTPMTTDVANQFFQNITGDPYGGDITFLSTLRALVAPRMGDDERIQLGFTQSSYSAETVGSNDAKRVVNAILDMSYYTNRGIVLVHNFNASAQEDNYACLELMKSTFCIVNPGFHRLEKVTEFFHKTFYVLCFINPDKKQVVLFADNLNVRKMHYLQCAIFAFLPWYFNPEDGVSPDEMALIQSLREKTSDKYEECLLKLSKQFDFRTAHIRRLLAGFETRYEKRECDNVKQKIQRNIRKIGEYNEEISRILREKAENEIRLLGLETKIANMEGEDSEIMEYFLCNDKLALDYVDDRKIKFAVKDYLTYFDEEMAKRVIDNNRSYIYRPNGRTCDNFIEHDDMQKLMYALFIDQTLRMKFCSAYEFELGGSVRAISDYSYSAEFNDCMPNTHIDRYRCLGNYERAINECLVKNDYIGAIEQSVASCKSLNFGDSCVMECFMERLYGLGGYHHNRCIELPDGRVVTASDAVAWMKEQEANANSEHSVEEDVAGQEQTQENEAVVEEHVDTDEERIAEEVEQLEEEFDEDGDPFDDDDIF